MFRELVFSSFNRVFIRNEDSIQSLITAEIIAGGIYN